MRLRSRLLGFLGRVILIFVPVCVLWYFIAPAYTGLVAGVTDFMSGSDVVISSYENTIQIAFLSGIRPATGYVIQGLDLQYGLLLAIALIGATPALRMKRRAVYLAVAVATVFLIHIVTVLVFASIARSETPASVGGHPLVVLFCIVGCDLFPVLVWGGLSLKHLLSGREADASAGNAGVRSRGRGKQVLPAGTGGA